MDNVLDRIKLAWRSATVEAKAISDGEGLLNTTQRLAHKLSYYIEKGNIEGLKETLEIYPKKPKFFSLVEANIFAKDHKEKRVEILETLLEHNEKYKDTEDDFLTSKDAIDCLKDTLLNDALGQFELLAKSIQKRGVKDIDIFPQLAQTIPMGKIEVLEAASRANLIGPDDPTRLLHEILRGVGIQNNPATKKLLGMGADPTHSGIHTTLAALDNELVRKEKWWVKGKILNPDSENYQSIDNTKICIKELLNLYNLTDLKSIPTKTKINYSDWTKNEVESRYKKLLAKKTQEALSKSYQPLSL